jgi:hypothetical protein
LLYNLPHALFAGPRRAFSTRSLLSVTSESVATLFFSINVLTFSPLVLRRIRTAAHAALGAGIRTAKIINIETVEAS